MRSKNGTARTFVWTGMQGIDPPGGGDMESRVVWIGGSSRSGKSTIGERIAAEYRYHYISGDAVASAHARDAAAGTVASRFRKAMEDDDALNEILLGSVANLADLYLAWAREEFDLARSELNAPAVHGTEGTVVDAFSLLPELVLEHLQNGNVVFLYSTEDFQRKLWEKAEWVRSIAARTADPTLAVANFIEAAVRRDKMLERQAKAYGLPHVHTGGYQTEAASYARVVEHLFRSSYFFTRKNRSLRRLS